MVGIGQFMAGHDWPLYGDEYVRIKFSNVPTNRAAIPLEIKEI